VPSSNRQATRAEKLEDHGKAKDGAWSKGQLGHAEMKQKK
jgi:hypothetical protein